MFYSDTVFLFFSAKKNGEFHYESKTARPAQLKNGKNRINSIKN